MGELCNVTFTQPSRNLNNLPLYSLQKVSVRSVPAVWWGKQCSPRTLPPTNFPHREGGMESSHACISLGGSACGGERVVGRTNGSLRRGMGMVLMLLIIGVFCGLVAMTVIAIRRVWSDESYLPDYEDILLYEQPGDGS